MRVLETKNLPPLLKEIHDPPEKLFVLGRLPADEIGVAIVGTREPSAYGKEMAKWFAGVIAKAGYLVISGLARGIDSTAHEAAIRASGKTIAVLGCGVDVAYPPENQKLKEKIIETGGAVISEFPLGTQPLKMHFPQRNRIISGLSVATLIIEAPEKSGALITADFAIEQCRDIFAVPANLGQKNSKGTNQLIGKGEARLIMSPEELISEIRQQKLPFRLAHPEKNILLPEEQKRIFELIQKYAVSFDDLLIKSGSTVSQLQSILTRLELAGLIFRTDGGFAAKPQFAMSP